MRYTHPVALLVFCLAAFLAACTTMPGTPTATTDYDHSFDFSHVHKIAIQPIAKDTVETMLISDIQIKRINQALIAELERRGFQVVTANVDADMYLSWKFISEESDAVSTFDPATNPVIQGTLYVSMTDPVMLQSEWRATFKTDLRDQPETPAAAQYRQQAAEVILAQFPPKPGAS